MFKPTVRFVVDVIHLSWTLHNVKTHQRVISSVLNSNKGEEMPSVLAVIETLLPHEQRAIDRAFSDVGPESWLLFLKRTKNCIEHGEMTFQGIPGLWFVIQQEIGRSVSESAPSIKFSSAGLIALRERSPGTTIPMEIRPPFENCSDISGLKTHESHTMSKEDQSECAAVPHSVPGADVINKYIAYQSRRGKKSQMNSILDPPFPDEYQRADTSPSIQTDESLAAAPFSHDLALRSENSFQAWTSFKRKQQGSAREFSSSRPKKSRTAVSYRAYPREAVEYKEDHETDDEEEIVNELLGRYTTLFEGKGPDSIVNGETG